MRMKWTKAQESAIETDGNNLIVSASAGSGKTAVLVERVVKYVASGGDVRRLVVLTFTKDSAREMKERVLEELFRRIRLDPENERLKEQAEYLPFANVTTIDGYCLDLVRRYFNELGEESQAEILSEDEAEVLLSNAADGVIDRFYDAGDETFFALLDRFIEKRDVKVLKENVFSLHRFLGVQAEREAFSNRAKRILDTPFEERATTKYLLGKLKTRAARHAAAVRDAAAEIDAEDPKFLAATDAVFGELSELSAAPDFAAFSRSLAAVESIDKIFRFDKVRKEYPDEYERMKNRRDDAKKFLKDLTDFRDLDTLREREDSVARFSKLLLTLADETDRAYRAEKRERGKLDFTDVERLAYRVLSDDKRREEIASEIDAVYLDEYQDTNWLQENILLRLSNGRNVFMVGDPKQAIYRFRLAEPGIFVGKYLRYTEHDGGEKVDLNENFRSDPEILRFVNLLFDNLMTAEFGGVSYREAARLKAGDALKNEKYRAAGGRAVEVCLYDKPAAAKTQIPIDRPYSVMGDAGDATEKKDGEGLRIARKIKEILGEPIYDGKSDALRPIRYRDIAVIVPKNKNAAEIRETLLKRGIPATLSGRGKEGENPDVSLIVSFLKAADNRRDDLPLVLTLLSPLGGFSGEELAEIRLSYRRNEEEKRSADAARAEVAADSALRGKDTPKYKKSYFWEAFYTYSGNETIESKIKGFTEKLDAARRRSGYMTVPELVGETLRMTEYDAYLTGLADGAERLQKLNLWVESLSDKEYAFRLKQFLTEAAELPTDFQPPASDGDAVKVMTFHASKGLEFPVVFAAHLGDGEGGKGAERTYFDKEFGVAVKFFDPKNASLSHTVFSRAFREKEKTERKEEALRLVYVALTRAKNRLYALGKRGKSPTLFPEDGGSFADWFAFASQKNAELYSYLSDFPEDFEHPIQESEEETSDESFRVPDLEYRYPYEAAANLGVKYTVSELNELSDDTESPPAFRYDGASRGKEEGILYHKVFQHIDFCAMGEGGAAAEIARLTDQKILTEEEARSVDSKRIADALKTDVFRLAANAETLREQPFMLYVSAREAGVADADDKVLVQGVIDLLIRYRDETGREKAIVVDYKDTALTPESAKQKYRKQILLYSLAAERILGVPVAKRLLYLLNRNAFIEIK